MRDYRALDTFYWLLCFLLLWTILTGAEGWAFGAACTVLASLATRWLELPFWRFRLWCLPRFCFFFLRELLLAGWDVAWRALHPRLPIYPGWVEYRLKQHNPKVTLLLSAMVGLLPGTLASRARHGSLAIHTLNARADWESAICRLETELRTLLGDR